MFDITSRIIEPMRSLRNNPERLRRLAYRLRALSLLPPLIGFAIMYLLAIVPQMREVYAGIIETGDLPRGLLGLALLIVLSAMLYFWHFRLSTRAIDSLFPVHADPRFDLVLFDWRNRKGIFCAAMPLAGLLMGLAMYSVEALHTSEKLDLLLDRLPQLKSAPMLLDIATAKARLGWAPLLVTLAVLIIITILELIRRYVPTAWSGRKLYGTALWTGTAITGLVLLLPMLMPSLVVPGTRLVGPLAGSALLLIALVTVLTWSSVLASRLEPTVFKGLLAAAAVLFGLGFMAWSLWPDRTTRDAVEAEAQRQIDREPLRKAFQTWLDSRGDAAAFRGRPYPVLIVAAQGGGIYAASAAASFLASLQVECHNFAQHVLAISGVSGGAIGTAVFNALVETKLAERQSQVPCGSSERDASFLSFTSDLVDDVILQDHLSPAISMIAPDFFRKLPVVGLIRPSFDRSGALERSFACSFDASVASADLKAVSWRQPCDVAAGGNGLRIDFDKSWSPRRAAPAAILNATWAEVGFRVAFAPKELSLRSIGDGTLYNFSDLPLLPGERPQSLIESAAVSARFPGIVPPLAVHARFGSKPLWSFVDGGYVDNSGATTARELYRALFELKQAGGLDIDLRLVLLTDAATQVDYSRIKGTRWDETLTPMTTLLSVRSQLSQRAVTQAIETVALLEQGTTLPDRRRATPGDRLNLVTPASRRDDDSHVLKIDIEQQAFKLPLGWKISRVTNDIVRLMMGHPALCPDTPPPTVISAGKSDLDELVETIEHNSCVKWKIIKLLKAQ